MTGATAGLDLSGQWSGIFNYPRHFPPTNFEASLRDVGGLVSGITTEPGIASRAGQILQAVIEGRRDGFSLHFVKIYDELSAARTPIHYAGTVSADGDEIEGRWAIPGHWSGTFLMVRGPKARRQAARRVAETV